MKLLHYVIILGFSLTGCIQGEVFDKTSRLQRNGEANQKVEVASDDALATLDLKSKSLEILEQNCASCHNLENAQGGFDSVLDAEEMIKSGRYIVPGDPDNSLIIERLAPTGNMPPSGQFRSEDAETLKTWIADIGQDTLQSFSVAEELATIRSDLERINIVDRPFYRYFSSRTMINAGANKDVVETTSQALTKVLNSLSFAPVVVQPLALTGNEAIVRVDLRTLALDRATFDRIVGDFYPFTLNYNANSNDPNFEIQANDDAFLRSQVASDNYVLRMDWFVATATLPELYKRFLNLPPTLDQLENQLGVTRLDNIVNNQVVRSGFRNSGVSAQNRVIERHRANTTNLPYWISYDFADNNEGQQNIFNFPLGQAGAEFETKSFDHDGGEVIFQLPNGMLGFYLNLADGAAIDKGPVNIVSQVNGPAQFFQAIVNGVSCMSCHHQGLLDKEDSIREFAAISQDFSAEEKAKIFNLYPSKDQFKALIDEDNTKYQSALASLDLASSPADPVAPSFQYYNKRLFRQDVQQELGLSDVAFDALLSVEPFKSAWVSIYTNSGSIRREEFNLLFGAALRSLRSWRNLYCATDWRSYCNASLYGR